MITCCLTQQESCSKILTLFVSLFYDTNVNIKRCALKRLLNFTNHIKRVSIECMQDNGYIVDGFFHNWHTKVDCIRTLIS